MVLQRLRVSLPSDTKTAGPAKRQAEFVDVNLLLAALLDVFRQLGPSGMHAHSHSAHYVAMLCALIGLFGGTDFTRGMPRIGPRRLWDALVAVFPAVVHSYDTDRAQLREAVAVDELLARVYARVFAAHVGQAARDGGAAGVLAKLQTSGKLGASTKVCFLLLLFFFFVFVFRLTVATGRAADAGVHERDSSQHELAAAVLDGQARGRVVG